MFNGTRIEINKALLKQYNPKSRLYKKDEDYILNEYFFASDLSYKKQLKSMQDGPGMIIHMKCTDVFPNATIGFESVIINITQ